MLKCKIVCLPVTFCLTSTWQLMPAGNVIIESIRLVLYEFGENKLPQSMKIAGNVLINLDLGNKM